jgi:hypothetical protein
VAPTPGIEHSKRKRWTRSGWAATNGQTLVEQNDVGLYPGEAPLRDTLQQRVFEMAGLALHRNMLVAELAAHRDGLSEPFEGRIALNHSRRHDRNIVGDGRARRGSSL